MLTRLFVSLLVLSAVLATVLVVRAAFIPPRQAAGTLNTAEAGAESLYICQPSGSVVSPICPIDTADADETIFVSNEDLEPGDVAWQKLRLRNIGTEAWAVDGLFVEWIKISDPSGLCDILPVPIVWDIGTDPPEDQPAGGFQGPLGVTLLGTVGGSQSEPVEGVGYDPTNDNGNIGFIAFNFQRLNDSLTGNPIDIFVEPGDYEDVLLGIRLNRATPRPTFCAGVVWQLKTTWSVVNAISP